MERRRGFFSFTLLSHSSHLPFFPCKSQKNEKQKQKKLFHTMGLDLGYLTRKVYVFKFFHYFWFAMIAQGARQRAYVAEKTRKKTFPYCFWFAAIAQGARQRAYAVREGNSLRLKQKKYLIIKLIRYERFKKNKSVTVTLYL